MPSAPVASPVPAGRRPDVGPAITSGRDSSSGVPASSVICTPSRQNSTRQLWPVRDPYPYRVSPVGRSSMSGPPVPRSSADPAQVGLARQAQSGQDLGILPAGPGGGGHVAGGGAGLHQHSPEAVAPPVGGQAPLGHRRRPGGIAVPEVKSGQVLGRPADLGPVVVAGGQQPFVGP